MKRWIAVLMSLVMVLSLMPMAVMAEEAVEGPPITALYVGTVNALETPSGDGWSFNRETGVLTLNNCTLTESMLHVETDEYGTERFDAMIYVKGDLTIELIGTNSVERVIEEAPTDYTSYYAICNSIYYSGDYERPGSLTFTGSGNLTVGVAVTRDCLSEDEWNMNEAWECFQFSAGIGSWSYTDLSGLYGGGWMDIYGGIYGVEGPYNVIAFANYPTFGDNCIVTAYRDVEGTVENENGYNWNNNDAWRMKVVTGDAYLKPNGQLILLDNGSASGEGWTWGNSVLTLSENTEVKAVEFRRTVGSAKVTLAGDVTLDATDMGYDANWNSISAVTAYCDLEIDTGDHTLTLHNSWADALRAELCDVTLSGGNVVTTNEGGYAMNMIGGDLTIQNATFRSANEIYLTEGYDADYNTIPAGDAVLEGAVVVLDSPITSYGTLTILSSDVTVTWGYDALYGNTAVTVRDSTLSIDAGGHALTSNSVVTVDNCNLNLTAEEAVIYHGYYHYEGDDESNIPDTACVLLQNMDITQPEGCSVQVKQTDSDYYTKYEVLVVDGDGNPATTLVATAAGNEHEHSYENGVCSCGAIQTFTVTWVNWDGTVLETDTVEYGTVPTYDGETPTRPNVGWDFRFCGWALSASGAEVTPGAATKDVTYYAKYTSTVHKHNLIFLDDDGVTELGRYETNYSKYITASWLSTAAGNPTKACCILTGWTYADGSAVESFYMPDEDVIFVAVWDGPNHMDVDTDADHSCDVCGAESVTEHSYEAVVIAPTCTDAGYTTYTCNCGDSYVADEVAALGHSYDAVVTAPTCTEDGSITDVCSACGDTQVEVIPATGHSYETVVTAPTCTEGGYTTYTCSACGDSYVADEVAALGHSFVNGFCTVCGEADPDYVKPSTAPTVGLKYPSLSFEDVIIMNVYYTATDLQDVVEMGLITYTEKPEAGSVETADQVIPGYTWSESDGFYFSSTAGIAPKDLGDTIYFAVYWKLADGTYGYTRVIGYSPKTYALNQLKTGSPEMRPLVAAMLNYGAAAQVYFNYKTDALVNATMTEEQKAMAESYRDDMIANVTQASGAKLGQFINDKTYSKRYPTISFEGAFCINYYFQPTLAVEGDVTMYIWSLEDYEANDVLTKENATKAIKMELTDNGEYMAVVDGIAAKDLDKATYVTFCYNDGTTDHCGGVLAYTIGMYCKSQASKTGTLAELAKACAVYGYHAKQYFGS